MSTVAFIGLGNMGLPMALNLQRAGHAVRGVELAPTRQEAARAAGLEPVDLAAALDGAEAVVTMLPAGHHVAEVYGGAAGVLALAAPGTLMIDSSTIDVDTARRVAGEAAVRGMAMIDAPVSGGVGGAAAGTLTFMVGGPAEAYARAEPLLQAMGRTIVHAGEAGAGQAAKICNNMMLGIQMISVCEAFALADRLGLERQRLFDIATKASGQCWSLTTYCPVPGPVPTSPANRDYAAGFTADMMLKDLRLAQAAAASAGAATPMGALAAGLYALMVNRDHGSMDFSGIFRLIDGQS